jgi:hypothetical protein
MFLFLLLEAYFFLLWVDGWCFPIRFSLVMKAGVSCPGGVFFFCFLEEDEVVSWFFKTCCTSIF